MYSRRFPKDVLVLLALELDYPDILNYCKSDERVNEKICRNREFWRSKLIRDFPNVDYNKSRLTPGQLYRKVYSINKVFPELKDILSLINIDSFQNITSRSINPQSRVKSLLTNLNPNVLNKIKDDYNSYEIYSSEKRVRHRNMRSILKFLNYHTFSKLEDYKDYYFALIRELKEYIKNPGYKFNPDRWQFE